MFRIAGRRLDSLYSSSSWRSYNHSMFITSRNLIDRVARFSNSTSSPTVEFSLPYRESVTTNSLEYDKWHNGGGIFHKSACIDPTAIIEIGAVVHSKCVISENVHIGSGTIIGPAVTVGQSTKIGYNVAVTNCTLGDSCIIQNGACIGQDGFGFFVDENGNMTKKPQCRCIM